MRRWGLGSVSVALTTALVLVGCGSDSAAPKTDGASGASIALIVPSGDSDYFRSVTAGAQEAASTSASSLTVVDDAASVASQVAAVRSAVDSGVDAILISPVGPEVDGAIQSARDSGVVVVDVGGTGYPSPAANFLVQTDDCVLGTAAGQWIQGRMPEGSLQWPEFSANFLLVLGDDGEFPRPTCRDQGWFEGAGIPIDVLSQVQSGAVPTGEFIGIPYSIPCIVNFIGDAAVAQREVTDCVKAHPEINAAYASTGSLARVAGEGLRRAGKTVGVDVMLTTVAGEDEGLELARGSWVNAAARPRAAATGGFAVSSALSLLDGQVPETQGGKPFLDTGVDLCTDDPKTAVFTAVTLPLDNCP